jgi:hypothetical protein
VPGLALSRAGVAVVEYDGQGVAGVADDVWQRLEALPDPRAPQGLIYPLSALVAAALCAMTATGHDRLTAITLRTLVPALEKVVGAPASPDRDAGALARYMRLQRSSFMGSAAGLSKQTGVWKIGDLHVADLMDGTVKVDTSRMNLVRKEDFDVEIEAWGG